MTKASSSSKKKSITLQLKRSGIATNPTHRANLKGLGLKRKGLQVVLENTPSVRGMIKKVIHLVEIVAETR